MYLQLVGGLSGRGLGISEGQEALWSAAQAEGVSDSVGLSDSGFEEPAAAQVSVCVVDSADDSHVDLEEVSGEVEFGFGGSAAGAVGAELPEAAGQGV